MTDEWLMKMAGKENNQIISVGGLLMQLNQTNANAGNVTNAYMPEQQAGIYAEEIAKMLFTAPDGLLADYLNACVNADLTDKPYESNVINKMSWNYVVQQVRLILQGN